MRQVKVILREDVPRLGDAGDLVSVKPGYARNYLIPQGLALPATEARVKELEHHRRLIAERQAAQLKDLQGAAEKVRNMDLSFEMAAGETGKLFGSITAAQIADRIAEQGVDIDRRKLQISETIKHVGEHDIKVRLHKDLVVDVKVTVTAANAPEPKIQLIDEEPEPIGFGSMDER